MRKYRIVKEAGSCFPYIPQYRNIFGLWRSFQKTTPYFPYQKDARFETAEEAEEAIKKFVKTTEKPILVKEFEL